VAERSVTVPGIVVRCYQDAASLPKKWVVLTIRQGGLK
jgi:hypothetical protein